LQLFKYNMASATYGGPKFKVKGCHGL